jgi:hypothetical protein
MERPEVIGTFSALVNPGPGIGSEAARILATVDGHLGWLSGIEYPCSDGHASKYTVRVICHLAAS